MLSCGKSQLSWLNLYHQQGPHDRLGDISPSSVFVYLAMSDLLPSSHASDLPWSQDEQQAREERTLEEADEKSEGIELWHTMHPGLSKCKYTPANFHHSQPVTWPNLLYYHRGRNLQCSLGTCVRSTLNDTWAYDYDIKLEWLLTA